MTHYFQRLSQQAINPIAPGYRPRQNKSPSSGRRLLSRGYVEVEVTESAFTCVACGVAIPPGRPGRKCKGCR